LSLFPKLYIFSREGGKINITENLGKKCSVFNFCLKGITFGDSNHVDLKVFLKYSWVS
jgi:hypothetical protein